MPFYHFFFGGDSVPLRTKLDTRKKVGSLTSTLSNLEDQRHFGWVLPSGPPHV